MEFTPFNSASDDAQSLVDAILSADADLTVISKSVEFVGGDEQTAFYNGSLTELSIGAGIFLTSGDGTPPLENTSGSYGVSLGNPGDSDLDAVALSAFPGAGQTRDANILAFSFIVDNPEVLSISFDLVFGSDEFPEFSNSQFVDIAAVFVNGTNQALFNSEENQPLSIIDENLIQGNFISNDLSGGSSTLPIEYDGVSSVLTILAPVQQGENTIKIGIADTGDTIYDSGLWVSNLSTRNLGDGSGDGSGGNGDGVLLNVSGTAGDDTLDGSALNEFFEAGAGNDIISAGAGNDVIDAGDGDDQIDAGEGDDIINPGSGNDDVIAGEGNDTVNSGQGNNTINGGSGEDVVVYSGDLGEFQVGKKVNTVLVGKSSGDNDELTNVEFLQFNDQLVNTEDVSEIPVSQDPNAVDDGLSSTAAFTTDEDTAFTTGNVINNDSDPDGDSLTVADFDDTSTLGLITNNGDGTFTYDPNGEFESLADGETATDSFTYTVSDGNGGTDTATVNITILGVDEITSGSELTGTAAADTIVGTPTDNTINALAGNDTVAGGLGNDIIFGGDGDDVLRGDLNSRGAQVGVGGDDIIYGGAGNDRIGGKGGNDTLFGDEGDDFIWGDDGDDIIRGGLGNDVLTGDDFSGGQGADTFVLAEGEGTDTIVDFEVSTDFIGLADGLTLGMLSFENETISFGSQTLAVLTGVDTTMLAADRFVTV